MDTAATSSGTLRVSIGSPGLGAYIFGGSQQTEKRIRIRIRRRNTVDTPSTDRIKNEVTSALHLFVRRYPHSYLHPSSQSSCPSVGRTRWLRRPSDSPADYRAIKPASYYHYLAKRHRNFCRYITEAIQ